MNLTKGVAIKTFGKSKNTKLQQKIVDYLEKVVYERNQLKEGFNPENI